MSVCIYVSIGEAIGCTSEPDGWFFLSFFPLQSCLLFFRHWAGAFSFFIQTGFYGVLHIIKHVFFHHIFFIFAFSPPEQHLLDISPLFFTFFLQLAGRIFFKRKSKEERKGGRLRKKRCDGWKGRAEKPWKCPFSLSSGNE